jgi:hypothetical protein
MPSFKTKGRVVWCRQVHEECSIGIQFLDGETEDTRVSTQMVVEHVYQIEKYKQEVFATEGRKLSGEEAAMGRMEMRKAEGKKMRR